MVAPLPQTDRCRGGNSPLVIGICAVVATLWAGNAAGFCPTAAIAYRNQPRQVDRRGDKGRRHLPHRIHGDQALGSPAAGAAPASKDGTGGSSCRERNCRAVAVFGAIAGAEHTWTAPWSHCQSRCQPL